MQLSKRGRGRPSFDIEDADTAKTFRKICSEIKLARDSDVPLWIQVKNYLGEAIERGQLTPSSRLPSEQAICEILEVSRPVVRAAIGALASEGLIIKMPRKGMFVAEPRTETDFLSMPVGVFGDMTAKGFRVDTETFEYRLCAADETERRVFSLPPGANVMRIGRVYMLDGQPLTLTHISLPGHKVPGLEQIDIGNRSVFDTIRERYGRTVDRADRWFTADMPDEEAVRLMRIPREQPLIHIESIAYEHDGTALEYYRAFYNSTVARVHISVD